MSGKKSSASKPSALRRMALSELAPNPRNPRKITTAARARLQKSMSELGNLEATAMLALNKSAGDWDRDALETILRELPDIEVAGFTEADLKQLKITLNDDGDVIADVTPERA